MTCAAHDTDDDPHLTLLAEAGRVNATLAAEDPRFLGDHYEAWVGDVNVAAQQPLQVKPLEYTLCRVLRFRFATSASCPAAEHIPQGLRGSRQRSAIK